MRTYALVMADGRKSKYGINACLGALEGLTESKYPLVVWVEKNSTLSETLRQLIHQEVLPIVLWSLYSPEFNEAVRALETLRLQLANEPLKPIHIIGGVHATAEPELCLRAGFDFVSQGEGERTMQSLVTALNEGRDLRDVVGLGHLQDDHFQSSRGIPLDSLDDSPTFAPRQGRLGPIEITRGCVYACSFCQTPFIFKAKFRHRSISSILWHVDVQVQRGMNDVRFITPTSLSYGTQNESPNLDSVEELLRSVKSRLPESGRIFFGSFPSEIRPEHASVEALRIIKKYADNDNVILGGQSGSNKMLLISHRGHDVAAVRTAVDNCATVGLKANVDFIFGMPGESDRDVEDTIELCQDLARAGARIHTHTFMPLPGTPWSHQPPGTVPPRLRRAIEKLTAAGRAYGNWEQQIAIAQEMAAFDSYSNRRKRQANHMSP